MDFRLSDEQRDFVDSVRGFARSKLDGFAAAVDGLPRETIRQVAGQGLAGITIAEADGGQGASLIDAVLAIEAMAQHSAHGADSLQVLNFGAIQQIARHGNDDHKARYLSGCLTGELVPAIAMTEPGAGSALTEMTTSAKLEGDHVVLDGQKIFSTNGDSADVFVVWARFGPGSKGAGAVLVERGTPGFEVDSSHRFMSREPYGTLFFDACRVPVENVLVAEDGFRRMLAVFNVERMGNASRSLGYGQAAFDMAAEYTKDRRAFGRRLVDFQGLQWKFAEMALKLESARLLLYRACTNADAGLPSALESSLAKVACNRAGFEVVNEALQMFGGYGYEEESPLSYMLQRTRGWQIAGGTTEQLLNRIAEGALGERFSQRPPRPVEAAT
jgi:alkylation response protein AidB-like acyl-CoA dehydrogenase